jgi:NTE family protein
MKHTLGLTLSGGGARAVAHLGLLQHIEEQNIAVQVLSGASAGALIATLWAKGFAAKEILEIIQSFSFRQTLQFSFQKGFLNQKKLYEILKSFFPENDFSALSKKVFVACTDLKSTQSVYFSEGKLIEPLLGTLAIPPLMKPIDFENYQLLDGGILDNLPVKVIRHKCDFLIASHCNPANTKPAQTMREAIEKSFLLAIAQNTQESKKIADYYFEPPALANFRFADLKKAKQIYETAYQYAKESLAVIFL